MIEGNFIGTDLTGTADLGNSFFGVFLNGAPSNTIGGTTAGARNVVSGNNSSGIRIAVAGATGNLVQGNFIGTDVTGLTALGNRDGIVVNGAPNNTFGGTIDGAGNLISGNLVSGVVIVGAGATGNQVQGKPHWHRRDRQRRPGQRVRWCLSARRAQQHHRRAEYGGGKRRLR